MRAGQAAVFTVQATAAATTPTYQWRRNGLPVPGATSSTFTLAVVGQGAVDNYDVVVSAEGTSITSRSAHLWVTLPAYPGAVAPDLAKSLRLEGERGGDFRAHAALPDGRYYLAGNFTSARGTAVRDLQRFALDGPVDATFQAPMFNRPPTCLALQRDGRLLVGGPFTTVDGVPTGGIVRLEADGTRDPTFAVGAGFSGAVERLLVTPSGRVYVSGFRLGTYQEAGDHRFLARLTPTGRIDPTFVAPTLAMGNFETNPAHWALGPAGELYLLGTFDRVNGQRRSGLVRLLDNGAIDPAFDAGAGPNAPVFAVVIQPDGRLVLGGDFTQFDQQPAGRIVRLTTDGRPDPTLVTGSGFSGTVVLLATLPGGALFVGTNQASYRGTPVPAGVRLAADGSLDPGFAYPFDQRPMHLAVLGDRRLLITGYYFQGARGPTVALLEADGTPAPSVSPAFLFPATARVLLHLPGSRILVAGNFTHVNGRPTASVFRLLPDLSPDFEFFPVGPALPPVHAGVVLADGRIVLFHELGASRYLADGSYDRAYLAGPPLNASFNAPPVALPGGRILLATSASAWGDRSSIPRGLVLLEENGLRNPLHPIVSGPPLGAHISGLHVLPGGKILVAGTFSTWAGQPRSRLVQLLPDGSIDVTFRLDTALAAAGTAPVLAGSGPAAQSTGGVVAFSAQSPFVLYRLTPTGARDATFAPSLPLLGSPGRIFIQPDNRIITAGVSDPAVPLSAAARSVAFRRLEPHGATDPTFSASAAETWQSVILADHGELLTSDGSGYLHRYAALSVPTLVTGPVSRTLAAGSALTLNVVATGTGPLSYQWYRNGTPLIGATADTLTFDSLTAAQAGHYAVTVSNRSGSVTTTAATLTVTARPLAGVYQGTLDGNNGYFSLFLRADGTGVFLGYDRSRRAVLVARAVAVSANRQFAFRVSLTQPDGAESDYTVEGALSPEGAISGLVAGTNLVLAGEPASSAGTTLAFAGFHQGGEIGTSSSFQAIAGPAGTVMVITTPGPGSTAGRGSLDAAGRLSVVMEDGARLEGSLPADAARFLVRLEPVQGARRTLVGANPDRQPGTDRLANLSVRSQLTPDARALTLGFFVDGTRAKPVLLRAVGPTLGGFAVANALAAARLELFRGTTSLATSGDWSGSGDPAALAATAARVGAFALGTGSRDAALLATLERGSYSATVTGADGATGVVLLEVYDASDGTAAAPRLTNVSTLAPVGPEGDPLTAGFYLTGTTPKLVLVRGAGASLAQFGIGSPLLRPRVTVYAGSTRLAENSGWSEAPDAVAIARAAAQVGAFPFSPGPGDAALLVHLEPGAYSAQVGGRDGTTGTSLVEIYEVR